LNSPPLGSPFSFSPPQIFFFLSRSLGIDAFTALLQSKWRVASPFCVVPVPCFFVFLPPFLSVDIPLLILFFDDRRQHQQGCASIRPPSSFSFLLRPFLSDPHADTQSIYDVGIRCPVFFPHSHLIYPFFLFFLARPFFCPLPHCFSVPRAVFPIGNLGDLRWALPSLPPPFESDSPFFMLCLSSFFLLSPVYFFFFYKL